MKVGYCRVSTITQAEDFDSLNQQKARLQKVGVQELFVDVESGTSDTRKNFNELMRLVKQGRITEVVVTRLDRLGRSLKSALAAKDLLIENNVKLNILDSPIDDPSSPFGNWHFTQMAAIAEFESQMLSERTRHGMNYFREKLCLQKAPFGYRLTEDYKLVIDKEKYDACKEILKLLLNGCSFNYVSEVLFSKFNISFSSSGIRHWIDNPGILGHTRYFTEMEHRRNPKKPRPPLIHKNTHEAIAEQKDVDEIKRIVKSNYRKRHPRDKEYPLKGLLRCAECGGGLHRTVYKHKSSDQETHYVRCNKHFRNKYECSNKTNIKLEAVQSQVIEQCIKYAAQIAEETSIVTDHKEPESLTELRKQLAGLEALGSNPAIKMAIQDVKSQISFAENVNNSFKQVDADTLRRMQAASHAAFWESLSEDKLALIFKSLLESVSVNSEQVVSSISWLFQ